MKVLSGLKLKELENLMDELGATKFRAKQIHNWIYSKSVSTIDEMTNLKVEIINTLGQIIETYTPKTYPISIPQQNTLGTYYIKITTGIGTTHIGKLIVI